MIPWFIVNFVAAIASLFGLDAYVRARSGNWWGAECIYFVRRQPGSQKLKRLGPYRRSMALLPAGGVDVSSDQFEIPITDWRVASHAFERQPPLERPIDPAARSGPSNRMGPSGPLLQRG